MLRAHLRRAFVRTAKNRAFALATCCTLAVACAVVSAAVDVSMYFRRGAPVPNRERFAMLAIAGSNDSIQRLSTAQFEALRAGISGFTSPIAYSVWAARLEGGQTAQVALVSTAGREAGDGFPRPRSSAAIVSSALQSHLSRGGTIRLNGREIPVAGFVGQLKMPLEADRRVDVLLPLELQEALSPDHDLRRDWTAGAWLEVGGWIAPGLSVDDASERVTAVLRDAGLLEQGQRVAARFAPFGNPWHPTIPFPLVVGLGVLAALLSAAVAVNLAILGMTRAAQDEMQVAIELALGARQRDIVFGLCLEWAILALPSTLLGIILGRALGVAFLQPMFTPEAMPFASLRATSCIVALLSALMIGTPSILRRLRLARSAQIGSNLLRGDARSGSLSLRGFRRILGTQFALGVVLLTIGLLATRTLFNLSAVRLAFRPAFAFAASLEVLSTGGRLPSLETLSGLRGRFGVQDVALVQDLPVGETSNSRSVSADPPTVSSRVQADVSSVGAGGFRALGSRITRGRDFEAVDSAESPLVAGVNEMLARRLWNTTDVLGKILRYEGGKYEVIAVIEDAKAFGPREPVRPFAYFSLMQQDANLRSAYLVVRTDQSDVDHVSAAAVRTVALQALGGCCSLGPLVPLQQYVDRWYAPLRALVTSLTWAAVFLVLLIGHGVFCVVSVYLASSRRELAIRRSLGADRLRIALMVMRRVFRIGSTGATFGVLIAGVVALQLSKVLYDVEPFDITTFCIAVGVPLASAGISTAVALVAFGSSGEHLSRDLQ
jgi:putative ABC transport system permease protein